MAKLDDLIGQVQDAQLRVQLVQAAQEIRRQRRFGLVFEEHIPETTLLHGFPVKRGATVYHRDDRSLRTSLQVRSVYNGEAVVAPPRGEEHRVNVNELLVFKRFGDPIYPALFSVGELRRGEPNRRSNVVINGENFHALQLLIYMYEGSVDCIYLDPPFNTGARDWKYNNSYVDAKDAWRHSKWLSFMEKRLRLARRLLKRDGVLIVMIDEHEVHHLGMLLERLFPMAYRQMVSVVINPKGVTQERFSRVEEYAHFCFLGDAAVTSIGDDLLSPLAEEEDDPGGERRPRWKGLLRSGTNARREDRKNMFYPVLIDTEREAVVGTGEPLLPVDKAPDFKKKIRGFTLAWPVRRDGSLGNWGVGHTTLRQLIEKGYVALGRYDPRRQTWGISYLARTAQMQIESGVLKVLSYDKIRNVVDVRYTAPRSRRIKTVWHRTTHDAGAYGTDLLRTFLTEGRKFPFPKSLYAVRDCLAAVVGNRPDAVVLDFFAGSGTTLHATALLNAQDAGSRTCILVTDNQVDSKTAADLTRDGIYPGDSAFEREGVFEAVTRPRIEAAFTGRRNSGDPIPGTYLDGRPYADGFAENVEFFRLEYLDPDEIELGRQFEAILPLLWLTAGGIGARGRLTKKDGFTLPTGSTYGVLLRETRFRAFAAKLEKRPNVTHVWLVTDNERAFAEMRSALPGGRAASMLYRDYLHNFRINTRQNI